jgi:transcription elongation factor Elf1
MALIHSERRASSRLVVRSCERCETGEHVVAVSRTERAVYFRCSQCGLVYAMTKPEPTVDWVWDRLYHPAGRL